MDNLVRTKSTSFSDLSHPSLLSQRRSARPGPGPGASAAAAAAAAADAAAQAEFNEKRWVWAPDEREGYVAGWVVREEGAGEGQVGVVQLVDGQIKSVPLPLLSKMNPPKFDKVEDIADLTFLNEPSVVHNLRQRYFSGLIYTYSGLFLVAINPYHTLPIYTDAFVSAYKGRRREENAPHVFAVADEAMRNMLEARENQSLLITGESGAGKTENTKKVIQYLAAIAIDPASSSSSSSHSLNAADRPGGLVRSTSVRSVQDSLNGVEAVAAKRLGLLERQILQANPILEAFGNAQTIRNNNSSRFGKFIRIEFTSMGAIAGANIDWYLLEKSRVTNRSENERSFHVFYQLLRSGDKALLKDLLLDEGIDIFEYLKNTRRDVDGVDDRQEWTLLISALDTVGFSSEEQRDLFKVVAAILHIGNIALKDDRSDQAQINNHSQVEKVCHILGLPVQEFTKALTRPRVKAGREWVTQARTKKQVLDEMAALCKTLYEKTFGSLVERVNRALDRPNSKSTFIGVLDIAGFEIFETNSFEQLCINYTNEKLQQFFNHHMFVLEQEEYARENIEWDFVNFGLDLQPTIDLIESTNPIGILSCLDEECIMPKATDATFTEKMAKMWSGLPPLKDPSAASDVERILADGSAKFNLSRFARGFTIKHYAGSVEYRTDGWLDKNRDPLNDNLTRVLAESSERFVAGLFAEYADADGLPFEPSNMLNGAPKRRVKRGAFRTVGQRHKEQLSSLMAQLNATQPHFVRCIVPNPDKKPGRIDVPLVLDQLRCNGVLEGIRIARLGYPNRVPFAEFRNRYEVLTPGVIPKGYMDGRKACQRLVQALDLDPATFKIGTSKIFFKAGVLADMEERRDGRLFDIFSRFQAAARMFTARRRIRKVLHRAAAVRTIQRNARIYGELKDWPWWSLYTKIRPLLNATRTDDELRAKEVELALAKERAERDMKEREALEELRMRSESDKRKVEEELSAERALVRDKEQLLARSLERQAQLEEQIAELERDLEVVDGQLDALLDAQKRSEATLAELRAKLDAESQSKEAAMVGLEGEVAELRAKLETEAKAKEAEQRAVVRLEDELAKADQWVADANQQVAEANQQTEKANQLVEELRRGATLHERKLAEHEESLGRVRQQSATALSQLQTKLDEESQSRTAAALADLRAQLDSESQKRTATALAGLQLKLETEWQARTDELERRLQAESRRASELQARLDAESRDGEVAKREARRLEDEVAKANQRTAEANRQVDALRADVAQAERKLREKVMENEADLRRVEERASVARTELQAQLDADSRKRTADAVAEVRAQLDAESQKRTATALAELQRKLETEWQRRTDELQAKVDAESRAKEAARREVGRLEEEVVKANEESRWTLAEAERRIMAKQEDVRRAQERASMLGQEWQAKLDGMDADRRRQVGQLEEELGKAHEQVAELVQTVTLYESDLKRASTMRNNKTIVEHVHVLEEAKRYTDRQLSETQGKLQELAQYTKSLEKAKARVMADNEELKREVALLQQNR